MSVIQLSRFRTQMVTKPAQNTNSECGRIRAKDYTPHILAFGGPLHLLMPNNGNTMHLCRSNGNITLKISGTIQNKGYTIMPKMIAVAHISL